jgi:Rrf2 family protein
MATDYGLLALCYLSNQEPERLVCAKEISDGYRIPPELLAKVLQKFARSGLVRSHAGPSGGYVLARPAAQIRVSEVLSIIEGPLRLVRCLNQDPCCSIANTCDIAEPMKVIQDRVLAVLGEITLEEIRSKSSRPEPAAAALATLAGSTQPSCS